MIRSIFRARIFSLFSWRLALGAALLPLIGGCEVLGVIVYKTAGPAPIKALYVPPKDQPMLVLVESYGSAGDIEIDVNNLNTDLQKEIKDNKIAPVVDPQSLEKLRESDENAFRNMTVDGIGRALGARQVLYVNVINSQLEIPTGNQNVRGVLEAQVRVVDAATGQTRWPHDAASQHVIVKTPWADNSAPDVQMQVRDKMADEAADNIARFFYDYKPNTETESEKVNVDN